jgi:hypothetical protein
MFSLDKSPANKAQFIKLVEFCKDILDICNKLKIKPIIYGSLAVFVYTQNNKMDINDIDLLIPEKAFAKIIEALKARKIKYNHDEKWHTLQIFKEDLKIELDSIDFWQKDMPRDFENLDLYGKVVEILSLNTLKKVYKKASEISQDNPQGNKKKYEMLNILKIRV